MGKVLKPYIITKLSVMETFLDIAMLPRRLPCYLYLQVSQHFQDFSMLRFNLSITETQRRHIINIYQPITKLQELNKHCNKHTNSNNKPLFKQLIISYKPGLEQIPLKFQVH